MGCCRNLTLIYIKKPTAKLVLLNIILFKVAKPTDYIK